MTTSITSTSTIAAGVADGTAGEGLPEGSRALVAERLQAAHQVAYDAERDRLVGLCSDVSYEDGNSGYIRAILGRAFGAAPEQVGPAYGGGMRPYTRASDITDYIGDEPTA